LDGVADALVVKSEEIRDMMRAEDREHRAPAWPDCASAPASARWDTNRTLGCLRILKPLKCRHFLPPAAAER